MTRREIRSWLMDMDGVLVREEHAIPGAERFIAALREHGLPFLVLTNNSIYSAATSPPACASAASTSPRSPSGPPPSPPPASSPTSARAAPRS